MAGPVPADAVEACFGALEADRARSAEARRVVRLLGRALAWLLVAVVLGALLAVGGRAEAAESVGYSTEPLNNCAGQNVGTGGTPDAALSDAVAKFTSTGNAAGCPYGLSAVSTTAPVYDPAGHRYTATGTIQRYTGDTFTVQIVGTCTNGCLGPDASPPSGGSSGPVPGVDTPLTADSPVERMQVNQVLVLVGAALMFGVGFQNGRTR